MLPKWVLFLWDRYVPLLFRLVFTVPFTISRLILYFTRIYSSQPSEVPECTETERHRDQSHVGRPRKYTQIWHRLRSQVADWSNQERIPEARAGPEREHARAGPKAFHRVRLPDQKGPQEQRNSYVGTIHEHHVGPDRRRKWVGFPFPTVRGSISNLLGGHDHESSNSMFDTIHWVGTYNGFVEACCRHGMMYKTAAILHVLLVLVSIESGILIIKTMALLSAKRF